MRRWLLALLALAGLAAGVGLVAYHRQVSTIANTLIGPKPYSRAAFDEWLTEPGHRDAFDAFTRYLGEQGVGEVVPTWQLTRTDATGRITCDRPQFLVPPRKDWRNIVPVLALVRDGIEPLVGEVEVYSSYRTPDFNTCIGGAGGSRHLGFRALDLVASEQQTNRDLFTTLCRFHRQHGARYDMGLGAYFDIEREGRNRNGRFHVDVSGYRSWGYSQHRDSSACKVL